MTGDYLQHFLSQINAGAMDDNLPKELQKLSHEQLVKFAELLMARDEARNLH